MLHSIGDLNKVTLLPTNIFSISLWQAETAYFAKHIMSQVPYQKLLSPFHIILGVILSLAVFGLMSVLLLPFTFSTDPVYAQLQACFTAIPITTVFWFSYHMFMIVLIDQRKHKANK